MRLSLCYTNGHRHEWFTFNAAEFDVERASFFGKVINGEVYRLVRVYRYA